MRRPAPLAALAALALALPLFAACSSSPDAATYDVGPQGPLSGTYSADSAGGTSPFVSITFTDRSHFSYISSTCGERAGASADDLAEDDPADAVADGDASPDYSDTDDDCVHTGTYKLTQKEIELTDDKTSAVTEVPISELPMNGTEMTDPTASVGSGSLTDSERELHTDALTTGDVGNDPLVAFLSALFGQSSVSSFNSAGTPMRRTGLVRTNASSSSGSLTNGGGGSGSSSASSSSGNADGSGGSLTTGSAVAAAMQWVNVKMPYCQTTQGGHEIDKSCLRVHGSTCNRAGAANNPAWNHYRSDCSGLVSYAWTLKAPGLTTREFTPGAAKFIPAQDLQPGDALLRAGHHIVLFEKWTDKASGKAKVIAEPGCSARGGPFAQEQDWSLGHAPGAAPSGNWGSGTYSAIRKNGSQLTK